MGCMPYDCPVMLGDFVGKKGVSLERLQTFCLIAEAGSMMAAAKGDPIRQSLFSRQTKELEGALGLKLLDRSSVPYSVTEEGLRLDRIVRTFLSGMDALLSGSRGQLPLIKIGAGESIIQWLLIPLLAGSSDTRGRRLQFHNLTSREAVEAVRSQRIEVAVVPAEDAAGDLNSFRVASYGVMAVFKPGLLGTDLASWKDLRGRQLALLEGRGAVRDLVESLNHQDADGPAIRIECTSYPQVVEACATGNFIGLVPEVAGAAVKAAGLKSARVKELKDLRIDLSVIWRNSDLEGARGVGELIEHLRSGRR